MICLFWRPLPIQAAQILRETAPPNKTIGNEIGVTIILDYVWFECWSVGLLKQNVSPLGCRGQITSLSAVIISVPGVQGDNAWTHRWRRCILLHTTWWQTTWPGQSLLGVVSLITPPSMCCLFHLYNSRWISFITVVSSRWNALLISVKLP